MNRPQHAGKKLKSISLTRLKNLAGLALRLTERSWSVKHKRRGMDARTTREPAAESFRTYSSSVEDIYAEGTEYISSASLTLPAIIEQGKNSNIVYPSVTRIYISVAFTSLEDSSTGSPKRIDGFVSQVHSSPVSCRLHLSLSERIVQPSYTRSCSHHHQVEGHVYVNNGS